MTTTEPTIAAWIDDLCPPALREEMASVTAELERLLEEIRPTVTRAGELLGHFELENRRIHQTLAAVCGADDAPDAYNVIDKITGAGKLHDALSAVVEAVDPFSNMLYAAIVNPGQLPVGVQVLIDTAEGERRVTPMGDERGGDGVRRFRTFDYGAKAEGPVITHDQLIEGIVRAQDAEMPIDVDLAEANAEVED